MMRAMLVLVAVFGASAFNPRVIFGRPRTRANALAYAKKAVFHKDAKDRTSTAPPPKMSRQGRAGMVLDPGYVPGSVSVPDWLLPTAAASCLSIPVMFLYISGGMDKDRWARSRSGETIQQRALAPLTRRLQQLGLLKPLTTGQPEAKATFSQALSKAKELVDGGMGTVTATEKAEEALPGTGQRSNLPAISMLKGEESELHEQQRASITYEESDV